MPNITTNHAITYTNTPVTIHRHGVGGRTIDKARRFDLTEVDRFKPGVVIVHIGTNDLTRRRSSPASVGSAIEDLVCLLHNEYGVRFVCVGQTVKRHLVGAFNANVQILAQYLQGVLEPLPFAIYIGRIGDFGGLPVHTCHTMVST